MAQYETIFILDSLLPPEDIDKIVERVQSLIEGEQGSVISIDRWGKKRLAYEIEKKQYGYYVAVEFEGKGTIPQVLESDFNFNDKVLRFLTYLYEKNKLKAMEKEKEKAAKKSPAEAAEKPAEKPAEKKPAEKPAAQPAEVIEEKPAAKETEAAADPKPEQEEANNE